MVKRRSISKAAKRFWSAEAGLSMVEGVIVLPLVLLVFAVLVEFGFAVFQWNQTVKAMQLGARMAAVSEPVADDLSFLTDDYPVVEGGPTPSPTASPKAIQCTAGNCALLGTGADGGTAPNLNADAMAWLIEGSDWGQANSCNPSSDPRPGMCDFNAQINEDNVVITYHRSGLGYVGRPDGPVMTVTVGISGLTFNLPLVGALIGVNEIEIPANPVTVTSEDMCTKRPSLC